jgi:hypothetical protein
MAMYFSLWYDLYSAEFQDIGAICIKLLMRAEQTCAETPMQLQDRLFHYVRGK